MLHLMLGSDEAECGCVGVIIQCLVLSPAQEADTESGMMRGPEWRNGREEQEAEYRNGRVWECGNTGNEDHWCPLVTTKHQDRVINTTPMFRQIID